MAMSLVTPKGDMRRGKGMSRAGGGAEGGNSRLEAKVYGGGSGKVEKPCCLDIVDLRLRESKEPRRR